MITRYAHPAIAAFGCLALASISASAHGQDSNAQAETEAEAEAEAGPSIDAEQETDEEAVLTIPVEGKRITDRRHPDYVRCRTERVMGSLAQRRKICMTNREWRAVSAEGNRQANELVEEHRSTSLMNN